MAKIATYQEFWPYYLEQHSQPLTRKLHTIGALIALAIVVGAVVTQQWYLLIAAPLVGYGFAWYSHFNIEHNRPATWDYPLWSFYSDGRMAWGVLRGKL